MSGAELGAAVREFLRTAPNERGRDNPDAAWAALEAAHIIGQRDTRLNVRSHVEMLELAWSLGDRREIAGQIMRIVGALAFTWRWVPVGNPGRASVSASAWRPIPADLTGILRRSACSSQRQARP
jgi:hypothetical protein